MTLSLFTLFVDNLLIKTPGSFIRLIILALLFLVTVNVADTIDFYNNGIETKI